MPSITHTLPMHAAGEPSILRRITAHAARRPFLLLACAYFVLNLARLPHIVHYFPDEQFYTNSGIRMAQGGSWLVPVYPDGAPRLEKPLLTYWLVALSFKGLGITVFASRLPFLLAGAALVWATARLALVLFESTMAACLAPILLMTSSYFDRLSVRATPDVLLCLFVTVSWLGFARILVRGDTSWQARAQFWCGIAAAVATKGGLGLLFLAFAVGALVLRHGAKWMRRGLVHVPSMMIALAIVFLACAQPILLADSNGMEVLYRDQIGSRLATSWLDVPGLLGQYVVSTIKYFPVGFGLVAVAAFTDRKQMAAAWRSERATIVLVLAWFALLLVFFSAANWYRGRYLAPAYPPLACALAGLLVWAARSPRVELVIGRLARALLMVLCASTLLFGAGVLRIDRGAGVALLLTGLAGLGVWLSIRASTWRGPVLAFGAMMFVVTAVIGGFVTPALEHAPVEEIAARLVQLQQPAAIVHDRGRMTSQMRLVSGGQLDVTIIPESATVEDCAAIPVWIVKESSRAQFAGSDREFEPCSRDRRMPPPLEMLRVMLSSNPAMELEQRAETFYLVRAPTAHGH